MQWKSRDGTESDEFIYYMSMDDGHDADHTITSAGLNMLTSEDIQRERAPGLSGFCLLLFNITF